MRSRKARPPRDTTPAAASIPSGTGFTETTVTAQRVRIDAYDIESNSWSHLKPTGTAPAAANTNAAFYEYDARLDVVLAIHFKGKTTGIFVYDPDRPIHGPTRSPSRADGPKFGFAANTCYDRELNAYFCHVAGDSNDNGVVWVYRYKKMRQIRCQSPRVSRTWRPCQQSRSATVPVLTTT